MVVLVYCLILFLTAFVVHVFIWKVRLPKNHSKILLAIFLTVLALGMAAIAFFGKRMAQAGIPVPDRGNDELQLAVCYISVMLAYVVTYSGIEVDSPSLVMVLEIHRAGPGGLAEDAFEKAMDNDRLVIPRLNDLLKGELASLEDGIYRLTAKGRRIARLFCFYRRVLGKEHKGG